jgi:hypothetical protein
MTAITRSFSAISNGAVDPDAPLLSSLMYAIRDNAEYLQQWLGASYSAGAVQDHNHDGLNSALVEIGPNLLRNGSFESGTTGWTLANYTGGTVAASTTGAMHGKHCLAISSTVLANGGGNAVSVGYTPVAPGLVYAVHAMFKATVANVSSQLEIDWYDAALALISSTLLLNTNTPTTATAIGLPATSPATAAYALARVHGGVPAQGSAVGTVYIDGVKFFEAASVAPPVLAGTNYYQNSASTAGSSTSVPPYTELVNLRIMQSGTYRVSYKSTVTVVCSSRIYKNGVAFGTDRFPGGAVYTEDLYFSAGDTIQIFGTANGGTQTISEVKFGVSTASRLAFAPAALGIGER